MLEMKTFNCIDSCLVEVIVPTGLDYGNAHDITVCVNDIGRNRCSLMMLSSRCIRVIVALVRAMHFFWSFYASHERWVFIIEEFALIATAHRCEEMIASGDNFV